MTEEKKYRYPGINSFETNDTDIFYGRDEDRRKLADLVEVEKNTLLYSRSGLGKSSLLKAALIPELTKRGYTSFYIRLGLYQADSLPPVQHVLRRTVLAEQKAAPVTFLHKFLTRTNSLWSVFKAVQIDSYPEDKPIVLIFDQFEEIGSYRNHIEDFKQQLTELLYTTIPQGYQEALSDDDVLIAPLTDAELDLLYKPLRIKVVFAIRSDQLNVMNELSDYLPNILKVYYELKPLSARQARQAIEEPGKKKGNFVTPPFTYQTAAVDKIIQSLDQKEKNEIDTAQLQILLQYIEQDIVERGGQISISTADLGNLNDVYRNYYHNSLQKLDRERYAAEELLEDALIAEGRRVSYDEALCRKRVSAATLDTLMKVRLLRQEPNTMGGYSYEISHDSLVEPILQTREERKRREEKAAEQAAFRAKLAEQRKKTARQRLILYIAMAAVVLSAGFAAWAVREKNKANVANALAQQSLAKAKKLIDAFYFYDGEFAIALKKTIKAENRFYFIDTLGNPVAKLGEWQKAEQFDFREGLAKVQNNGIDYLLDTIGNADQVAYDTAGLNNSITALDLSNKKLDRFPNSILQNTQLRILKLTGNSIAINLPDAISNLKNLTHLHLGDFKIVNLTGEIGKLQELNFLDISNNELSVLPPGIIGLKKLSVLDVSRNKLQALPQQFADLQQITLLDLRNNKFGTLPSQITQLTKLKALYAGGNNMQTIPEEIGRLENLTILGLNGNQLKSLPSSIGKLHKLEALGVNNNHLTNIPSEIGELQNLTELNFYSNQLTTLPSEIGKLKNLSVLGLINNNLTSLPLQIKELKKLVLLNLDINHFKIFPDQVLELEALTGLGLNDNQLTELPSSIGKLKNLTELGLSNNYLTELPKQIGELKNLTGLALSNNNMTKLPEQIGLLKNLKILDLQNNQMMSLIIQIGQLRNLTALYLDSNHLSFLPVEIGNLKQLTELTLRNNKVTMLPAQLSSLKNLTTLDIGGNQISTLPLEIGYLRKLNVLNIDKNKLTTLPVQISELKNLKLLTLSGNDLSEVEKKRIRQLLPGCEIRF